MSSSASRREHTPLLAMYRFKRILTVWTGAASSVCRPRLKGCDFADDFRRAYDDFPALRSPDRNLSGLPDSDPPWGRPEPEKVRDEGRFVDSPESRFFPRLNGEEFLLVSAENLPDLLL
jgi:hypothetical protein